MKEMTPSEMIYHLIRLGANGNSVAARNVQLLAITQARHLKKSGKTEEADNILKGLSESGYDSQSAVYR